jgi:2-polyprenyl-3-methyl-5-hydroxy-6-metoxy-1,4-benzoquinol methylase
MSATGNRPCPACRAPDSRARGDVSGFRIQACRHCKTLFTAHLPTTTESTDYGAYYHDENLEVPAFVHRRLEELVGGFDDDRRLNRWLDVGCGAGALLEAARWREWQVTGTEIAEPATEAARARGLDVRSGELGELDLAERSFDVVSMVEVLEHVPDVSALLTESRRLLRPGGALYVTTPHARGISGRLLGMRWSVVSPPEHLQLFSARGLRIALASAGLSIRTLRTHAVNPSELLRTARFGTEPMRPGARVESGYRLNESLLSTRAGAAFRGVANAALGATRLGDTIKLVAERPG